MESNSGDKSRKEKRKEGRLAKQQNRFLSWTEHQKSKKVKRDLKRQTQKKSKPIVNKISETSEVKNLLSGNKRKGCDDVVSTIPKKRKGSDAEGSLSRKSKSKVDSSENVVSTIPKKRKEKNGTRQSKSKFEEYLEMEMKNGGVSAQEDLELERKLAKKLKVKGGKLRGMDDGMDMLFDGLPSIIDTLTDEDVKDVEDDNAKQTSSKKRKSKKISNVSKKELKDETTVKKEEVHDVEDDNAKQTSSKKRKRKKVSNVSKQELEDEATVEKAVGECATLPIIANEVVIEKSSEKPPTVNASAKYVPPHLRSHAANESEEFIRVRRQVRGLLNRLSESNVESITGEISTIFRSVSRSVGSQIITEEVLGSCSGGPRGNEQYAAVFASFVAGMACLVGVDLSAKLFASLAKSFEDEFMKKDNLSLRNLTLLLSYLCIFGVCSSDLIYDFLTILSKRLLEIDVSTILTILNCCGMKLRGDDPAAMKDFIVSIQNRVSELKSSSGDRPINNKRMEFMLDTICDIKNNKKKSKEDPVQHTRIKKWLQKLRVEDVLLRGLKWNTLLDPNKKGQWWVSGDVASSADKVGELASTINKEVLEAQKLLQLAASQRMNTDARRAIFCVIMSGEDYVDAFEKLLRLDLAGKQDREIMRVIVECCLQEKVFNKYYTVLASKLCSHDKNHKFTLQYCLWDHYKGLDEMELIRSMNLAKFVTEILSTFSLSLAVLKTIDFSDPVLLTPKRIMHFRMLFEAIFELSDALIWNMFTRIAITPELEVLRNNLEFFIKQYVASSNKSISIKFKIARKAMNNISGVLM